MPRTALRQGRRKKKPLLFIRIPCLPLQVLPRCSILHQPEISSLRDEHHLLNDMKKSLINHKHKAKKMFKECLKIIIFLNNLSDWLVLSVAFFKVMSKNGNCFYWSLMTLGEECTTTMCNFLYMKWSRDWRDSESGKLNHVTEFSSNLSSTVHYSRFHWAFFCLLIS